MIEDGILVGKDDKSSPEADEQGSFLSVRILRWTSDPTRTFAGRETTVQDPHKPRSHQYHLR